VLLPSDTHRKPVTSITAVLLTFVTYLLILSYTYITKKDGNELVSVKNNIAFMLFSTGSLTLSAILCKLAHEQDA
jgi:uncharacterized membrane protein